MSTHGECFDNCQWGKCGQECDIYHRGDCPMPDEMIEHLDDEGMELHRKIYGEGE